MLSSTSVQPPRHTLLDIAALCFSSFNFSAGVVQFYLELAMGLLSRDSGPPPGIADIVTLIHGIVYPFRKPVNQFIHAATPNYKVVPIAPHLRYQPRKPLPTDTPPPPIDTDLRADPCLPLSDTDEDAHCAITDAIGDTGFIDQWLSDGRYIEPNTDAVLLDNRLLFHLMDLVFVSPTVIPRFIFPPETLVMYVVVIEAQSRGFWTGYSHHIEKPRLTITDILCVSQSKAHVTYTSTAAIAGQIALINRAKNPFVIVTDRTRMAGPTRLNDTLTLDRNVKNFIYPFWSGTSLQTRTLCPSDFKGCVVGRKKRAAATDELREMVHTIISTHYRANCNKTDDEYTISDVVRLVGRHPFAPAQLERFRADRFDERCVSSLSLQALATLVEDQVRTMNLAVLSEVDAPCWWTVVVAEKGLAIARAMFATAAIRLEALPKLYSKIDALGDDAVR
jgi:hypothetical protein